MPVYRIAEDYQGYVRGCRVYVVEAASAEDAKRLCNFSHIENDEIIRDDTEVTDVSVDKVAEDYR